MPNQLQSALTQLASKFAAEVFAALRSMSLEELLRVAGQSGPAAAAARASASPGGKRGRGGRRGGRRTSEELTGTLERIVGLVKSNPGLRAEQIRAELGLAKNEIERPIAIGLANGQLTKKGDRRATKYFVKGAGGGGAKRGGKRGRKKAA